MNELECHEGVRLLSTGRPVLLVVPATSRFLSPKAVEGPLQSAPWKGRKRLKQYVNKTLISRSEEHAMGI